MPGERFVNMIMLQILYNSNMGQYSLSIGIIRNDPNSYRHSRLSCSFVFAAETVFLKNFKFFFV
jgi:hypothetical protein